MIPDYQSIMLPLLGFAGDKKEHSAQEAIEYIVGFFNLSELEKNALLSSGRQYVIDNRVGWASTYLKKAGLLESTRRSYFKITDLGENVLRGKPKEINVKFLEQFPKFIEFRNAKKENTTHFPEKDEIDNLSQTPQELLETSYQKITRDLIDEILALVKQCSPRFFENLVVELLLKMGYGGSLKEAGRTIGQSGDGGVDGIIKEDKLGLDVIYIQAKRWQNTVGSPEIRNFVGSLVGKNANKGIFITTSSFTKEAQDYVKTITHKVILIDGEMLAQLMIENGVGVSTIIKYEIKRPDTDYFIEE